MVRSPTLGRGFPAESPRPDDKFRRDDKKPSNFLCNSDDLSDKRRTVISRTDMELARLRRRDAHCATPTIATETITVLPELEA